MSGNKQKNLQNFVDNYIESGLSASEYVEVCIDSGDITEDEGGQLLSILKEASAVTFKLSEVNDDFSGLRMVLTRKKEDECSKEYKSPVFEISINKVLNQKREAVIASLQNFAKEIAVLVTHNEDVKATDRELYGQRSVEEWAKLYPNMIPMSDTQH